MFELQQDKTNKMACAPRKDSDHPVWSEYSLSAWRNVWSLATHWTHSKDSDQTGRKPRLIWVFAGCTGHFVGFVVLRLVSFFSCLMRKGTIMSCGLSLWDSSNAHVQPLSRARDVVLCLKFPLHPGSVWGNSKGSGEMVQMRWLTWAFTVYICDKNHFHMIQLILGMKWAMSWDYGTFHPP